MAQSSPCPLEVLNNLKQTTGTHYSFIDIHFPDRWETTLLYSGHSTTGAASTKRRARELAAIALLEKFGRWPVSSARITPDLVISLLLKPRSEPLTFYSIRSNVWVKSGTVHSLVKDYSDLYRFLLTLN
ncbi:hypothetical protein [Sanxia atyid shrimp virus 1]|uniref:hypothetical protein n=1 Tax=Sanxia atyid shrimp virus 1 TaxID=1923355 RepID=UPI00090C0D2F|nr:hypothetical protein [Sanxia atyid shrimp virus 1]APG77736.1 hypothetical protein [Sanxia atyid shrimp virus 1]